MLLGNTLNIISTISTVLLFTAAFSLGCRVGERNTALVPDAKKVERVEVDIGDPVGVIEITDPTTIKNLVRDMCLAFDVGVNDSAKSTPRILPSRKCILFTGDSTEEYNIAPFLIRSPSGVVIRNQVLIERDSDRGLLESTSLLNVIRKSLDESLFTASGSSQR